MTPDEILKRLEERAQNAELPRATRPSWRHRFSKRCHKPSPTSGARGCGRSGSSPPWRSRWSSFEWRAGLDARAAPAVLTRPSSCRRLRSPPPVIESWRLRMRSIGSRSPEPTRGASSCAAGWRSSTSSRSGAKKIASLSRRMTRASRSAARSFRSVSKSGLESPKRRSSASTRVRWRSSARSGVGLSA